MPKITEVDKERLKENCAVCHDTMNIKDSDNWPIKLSAKGCGHIFHVNCISDWATQSGSETCPTCRRPDINEGYYPEKVNGQWKWIKLD